MIEKVEPSLDTGQNYWGDGLRMSVEGNIGLPLGSEGFLNISAAKTKNEATIRSEIYCESWWCQNPDGAKYEAFLENYPDTRAIYAADRNLLRRRPTLLWTGRC